MAESPDVHKIVHTVFSQALEENGVDLRWWRKPPSDAASKTPFAQYSVTTPVQLNNSPSYHKGLRCTITVSIVADDFGTAVNRARALLVLATTAVHRIPTPHGTLTHISVTQGVESTNTSLSASELEQVTVILSGIARKE